MARRIGAPTRAASALVTIAIAAAACSRGDDAVTDGPLRVVDAWVRPTHVTATGAMYLTLENMDTATVLIVGAETAFARAAEFHETMEMQGMSHMNKLDSIPIARGATLSMKAGGMHLMLIDLNKSIGVGDTIPLVIHLGDSRTTRVNAIARDR